jgi:hypothetical protein
MCFWGGGEEEEVNLNIGVLLMEIYGKRAAFKELMQKGLEKM